MLGYKVKLNKPIMYDKIKLKKTHNFHVKNKAKKPH